MRNYLSLILIFLLFTSSLLGQIPEVSSSQIESQARKELQKRGLKEDIVRKKLSERGIDIDNIDANNPSEVFKFQEALEEVIKEIELEKKEAQEDVIEETTKEIEENSEEIIADEIQNVASEAADDISDAIKDGATIEEAVAEGIIDAQSEDCLLYTSPSPRDRTRSRMPSSA